MYKRSKRKNDELRPIETKVGVVKRADGSAMFKIGDTIAIAAVYGPRELYPAFQQNVKKGVLRCSYDLMSFSVTERKRPGPSRRSTEISMVTENALSTVVDLDDFPNTVVDVFIDIVQADASTRCAGICAAAMALADAGIPMKDLVSAVSVGKVDKEILLDIDKEEEDVDPCTDIPVSIIPRTGKINLLQLDGNVTKEDLKKAIEMAKKGCEKIYKIQKEALKERYKNIENGK